MFLRLKSSGSPMAGTFLEFCVIHTAARLITGTRKYDHMSPVLRDLHWLKIDESIDYKVLLLMFKCLFDEGLTYLLRDFNMLSSIPGKQKLISANSLKVDPGEYKDHREENFLSNRSYPVESHF